MNGVCSGLATAHDPWLVRLNQGPERVRLVCFPYAGGSPQTFHAWRHAFGAGTGIYAVHLPGRGRRFKEAPLTRMAPLVESVAAALRPLADRPLVFFGHSMGALSAFETARALRRKYDLSPAHLFLSAYSAPEHPRTASPLHALPTAEVVERLRALNGTPPEALEQPEVLELMLPVVRADFAVIETYDYHAEPPLAAPISVLAGLEDEHHPPPRLEAWRNHTTGRFARHVFPGGHFFLHAALRHVVQLIEQELGRVGAAPTGRTPTTSLLEPVPVARRRIEK